ncbi:type III-B CRISPR-associated protein Cas10/Cmr2 [Scytonema sp. UIC 10036]|uniref:type III-B CRISPR-associated protein Cas10/Cmr2 n=1 Tax=Scytonema sp. UIC 10036 TaxID=2304196 RepID=UPI0012DA7401|nr:type III-B CRISPR-associated protein Cas10/Cmr2 [Scytonema sp. UIC 10036]MUG93052.1 type III-B CRISPR-associated protein Cas10/Cmr2 [Scytonema sp. UIC 10036]
MNFYQRKLYALLQSPEVREWRQDLFSQVKCLESDLSRLKEWWDLKGSVLAQDIGSSSDRVNLLHLERSQTAEQVTVRHPISAQKQQIAVLDLKKQPNISHIKEEPDAKKVFWWFWRFYPELLAEAQHDALLFPAHTVIPDCPLHSHQSTVSALTGAMFPESWQIPESRENKEQYEQHRIPYLLVFTFSPVQDFIKSSRKFLDFWAGSYLLHYLSTRLCWLIAEHLGPDAAIVPSLWSQEIIDAFIVQKYPDFASDLARLHDGKNPVERFKEKISTSLSTAGFPNAITVLVSGEEEAREWGKRLSKTLTEEWVTIGTKVKNHIRKKVIDFLDNQTPEKLETILNEAFPELKNTPTALDIYRQELQLLRRQCCWEWNKLWEAQLNHTWEPYWTAIPLGNPEQALTINKGNNSSFDKDWIDSQTEIARPLWDLRFNNVPIRFWTFLVNSDCLAGILFLREFLIDLPNQFEKKLYTDLNVGTWWGSIQQRLRHCLTNVKYTRNWQIATAPGERSTISGQLSAVHPRLNYQVRESPEGQIRDLREGSGVKAGSMRLFWFVMSKAYPGLFNGSEKLNALELTKRMAWVYGGVAESLGIPFQLSEELLPDEVASELEEEPETSNQNSNEFTKIIDYEQLIRFPNLSSIAAAAFAREYPNLVKAYRSNLYKLFQQHKNQFSPEQRRAFYAKTSRPFHVPNTDNAIQQKFPNLKGGYNGVMFSSKWLIDDMGLQEQERTTASSNTDSSRDQNNQKQVSILREIVQKAHQQTGFGDSSPADWWVILLADGDGMGDYVSGKKLKKYRYYVDINAVNKDIEGFDRSLFAQLLACTHKRMGPATHVGLNRALLDFSNRLVPYITEKRFCGRVIYSGGDDVMVVLPVEDLPEYLLSLRAAWSGGKDPKNEFENNRNGVCSEPNSQIGEGKTTGYWYPGQQVKELPKRPHFTMGKDATMSAGVVIAHKSVPLPTVLENLWEAEAGRAKKMPGKDGICFRVIYGGGNQLEALMKGELLETWWDWVKEYKEYQENLAPLLYRLAEELPKRASITENDQLFSKAAKVIMESRENSKKLDIFSDIKKWLDRWEEWARGNPEAIGAKPEDLGKLLRFTAFWVDKRVERHKWKEKLDTHIMSS